jgi:ferric-dicitrate binding protein FerR (iron transport regulator)
MNQVITQHIVAEHFAGRATPLQRQALAEWLQEPANQALYYTWLLDWERQNPQYAPDGEAALHRILADFSAVDKETKSGSSLPDQVSELPDYRRLGIGRRVVWLAAASLVLVAGLWISRPFWFYKTDQTAYGEVRAVTLPDGSRVTLNANSRLRYNRWFFNETTRRVELSGEARFEVRHLMSHQPFVVKTPNGLDVVVLGTTFNVYARSAATRVALQKGKVELRQQQNGHIKRAILRPGDLIVLDRQGRWHHPPTRQAELQSAWQRHEFVFDHTSLTEVGQMLSDSYGLRVNIPDSTLAARTLSGTFQARSASELLPIVAQLLDINYRQENDHVTFSE